MEQLCKRVHLLLVHAGSREMHIYIARDQGGQAQSYSTLYEAVPDTKFRAIKTDNIFISLSSNISINNFTSHLSIYLAFNVLVLP